VDLIIHLTVHETASIVQLVYPATLSHESKSSVQFIDYDELAVQPHAGKPRNREAKSRGDCFFLRRVQP
jgi:hypothetical protein